MLPSDARMTSNPGGKGTRTRSPLRLAWASALVASGLVGCHVDGGMGVGGVVTDATTAAPVAGARVCAFDRLDHERDFERYRSRGDCAALPEILCTDTDGSGSFGLRVNLPGLGRDEVWVVVCAEGYRNYEQVIAPSDVVETEADAVATIDVALSPSGS